MGTATTFAELIANPASEKVFLVEIKPAEVVTNFTQVTVIYSGETCRLSLVNGTAFIDGLSFDPALYINGKIEVDDGTGKKATGYFKAAGTGETYGSGINTNPTWDVDTTDWTPYHATIASVTGGQSGKCLQITFDDATYWPSAGQTASTILGALYKTIIYIKSGTAGSQLARVRYGDMIMINDIATTEAWSLTTGYAVASTGGGLACDVGILNSTSTGTILFDELSTKQVLTPSTTGATIVSAAGGSTYNWTSMDSGFNLNDSSGYTYILEAADRMMLLGVS